MDFSTKLEQLTNRQANYDKPTNKQLQDIGIIEYFWQAFFAQAIAEKDWEKSAIDLRNIIQERCINNLERRYTLTILKETIIHLQESAVTEPSGSDNDCEKTLILLEGIKDWARKSIVRGADI